MGDEGCCCCCCCEEERVGRDDGVFSTRWRESASVQGSARSIIIVEIVSTARSPLRREHTAAQRPSGMGMAKITAARRERDEPLFRV